MKKTISLILCIAMCLSSIAFCFPAFALEVQFAVESPEDYAIPEEIDTTLHADEESEFPKTIELSEFTAGARMTLDLADNALTVNLEKRYSAQSRLGLVLDLPVGRYKVTYDVDLPENFTEGSWYIKPASESNYPAEIDRPTVTVEKDDKGSHISVIMDAKKAQEYDVQLYIRTTSLQTAFSYKVTGAKIETLPIEANIIFDANGGQGSCDAISALVDETVELPDGTGFEREYYDFAGWSLDKDAVPEDAVSAYDVKWDDFDANSNVTFYAIWQRRTYEVAFELENDAEYAGTTAYTINEGEELTLTLPNAEQVTRDGFYLEGWTDASGKEYAMDESVTFSEPTVLKPVWKVMYPYSVIFDIEFGVDCSVPTTYRSIGLPFTITVTMPGDRDVFYDGAMLRHWVDDEGNIYQKGETATFEKETVIKPVWLDLGEYGSISPVSVSTYDGKTSGTDLRYPGVYYRFDEDLDPDTVTLNNISIESVASFNYDAETKTLALYPSVKAVKAGATITVPAVETAITTADGSKLVFLPTFSYTFASSIPADGGNLIPTADCEHGFFPYYTGHEQATVNLDVDEEGNHYAVLRVAKDGNAWPHAVVSVTLENGATYRYYGRAKSLGTLTGQTGSLSANVTWQGAISDSKSLVDGINPLGAHANGFNHQSDIGKSSEWAEFVYEFTVSKTGSRSDEGVTVYSNPVNSHITEFAVDDLRLYKKENLITYESGAHAVLKDGAEEPENVAAFLDGKDETTFVLPEMPYEIKESDAAAWTIDAAKPWIDQNGNTYAAGETVDIMETGMLTLTPNASTSEKFYTVTFVGDKVASLPSPAKIVVGAEFDPADYYNVTSSVSGLHFNGWSTTGEVKDILEDPIELTEDITLYAIVNMDFNFAVPANRQGWSANHADIGTNGKSLVLTHQDPAKKDIFFNKTVSFKAATCTDILVVMDAKFAGEGMTNPFVPGFNCDGEGLFFSRTGGEGDNWERKVSGSVERLSDDGAYAFINLPVGTHRLWNGTIAKLRFDMINERAIDIAVRYIHFVTAPVMEEDSIDILLDAPVTGVVAPSTAPVAGGIADVTSISWTPAKFVDGNKFGQKTVYTAEITVSPSASTGKALPNTMNATVGGEPASYTLNADGTATIVCSFPRTKAYLPFEIVMDSSCPTKIEKAGRVTTYKVKITGEIPDATVTWSTSDPSIAVIDAVTGKLEPIGNGTVTVTAQSNYNHLKYAQMTVEISDQREPGTLTYHTSDPAHVTGMPSPVVTNGKYVLSDAAPVRDGYLFIGWADKEGSTTPVTEVLVSGDTDVYAIWAKGIVYGFGSKLPSGWRSASIGSKKENYSEMTTTVGDHRINFTNINLDPKVYRTIIIRIAGDAPGVASKIFYKTQFTRDGKSVIHGYDVNNGTSGNYGGAEASSIYRNGTKGDLDTFENLILPMYDEGKASVAGAAWSEADSVHSIYLDPYKVSGHTFRIEYMAIVEAPKVTFNANTTDSVVGMPEDKNVSWGGTFTVSEVPVREGYEFSGWATSSNAAEGVKTFTTSEDITLYAVWTKLIDLDTYPEDGKLCLALDAIDANAEVILVQTSAPKGESVVLTYTDENNEVKEIKASTNAIGYAIIDLSEVSDFATNAVLSVSDRYTFKSVLFTTAANAETVANTVQDSGKQNVGTSGGGGSRDKYDFGNSVEDVKNDGKQYTVGTDTSDPNAVTLESLLAAEDRVLLNFENASEKNFFKSFRQMTQAMNDSVLTLTANGFGSTKESPAAFTTGGLNINADKFKYIVVKAKHSGLSNPGLQVYFHKAGEGFAEAKSKTAQLTEDYSMIVYDMSAVADWNGKMDAFFFSTKGDVKGTIDIDWILFTDKVPESMDEIAGAKETFPTVNKGAMPFTDVPASEWYHSEINTSYKLGFVQGTSETTYEPNGNVTVAEAITLAVRINCIEAGKDIPTAASGAEWYKPFVDAAVRAGIIKNNQFTDYNAPALRKEVASIMAKALPSSYYNKMNMFTSIPDVDKRDVNYSAILKLYNAGIVIGSDEAYNFTPETNVTRAEVAAIANRLAIPANRKRVVTDEEIESRKKKFTAEDIVASATLSNCEAQKLVLKNGLATGKGKNNDPIVNFLDLMNGQFNGKDYKTIRVGMKWDQSIAKEANIYFTTPSGGWAGERMISSTQGETDANGVVEFVFDTTKNAQFANTITGIRFDPFNAPEEFGLAYITFEP